MPIRVSCGCGKQYDVKEQFAGKQFKCKSCDATLRVPNADSVAEPVRVQPRDEAQPQSRQQIAAPHGPASAEHRQKVDELRKLNESTGTAASNPGMLRVSRWRWFKAFPKWPIIWHGLFLASLVLGIVVHWSIFLPAAFFAYCCYFYWNRVKSQFIAGCVNPGQVVSVNPPLVAVLTNLTKGGTDCNVIKVLRQPLSKMIDGEPSIGQRVATVAFYNSYNDELDHWDDFDPVVVDCVAAEQADITRVLSSIESDDWQELADNLPQIPSPPVPGLYRVYSPSELASSYTMSAEEIPGVIEHFLSGCRNCFLTSEGIDPKAIQQASAYVPPSHIGQLIALVETSSASSDAREGLALTAHEVLFHFQDVGRGSFRWGQLGGAFLNQVGLELAFRDGTRTMIPKKHYLSRTGVALENLFRSVCEE